MTDTMICIVTVKLNTCRSIKKSFGLPIYSHMQNLEFLSEKMCKCISKCIASFGMHILV